MDENLDQEKANQMYKEFARCYDQSLTYLIKDALVTKNPILVYVEAVNPFAVLGLFHGAVSIGVSNISYN